MVFAIIDYINYKLKRNQYSFAEIKEQGGFELNDKNYDRVFPLRPGIILIHHPNSFISWLIMYFDGGVWSHTINPYDEVNVFDVTLGGSIIHSFKDYFNKGIYAMIFCFNIPEDKVDFEIGEKLAKERAGNKYGYYKALRLFFFIVTGRHHSYRIKFTIDILMILILFHTLFILFGMTTQIFYYFALVYIILTIIGNTLRYLGIGKFGPSVKEYKKFRKEVLDGYKNRGK